MTRINGREYPGIRKRVSTSTGAVTYQARWRPRGGDEEAATFDDLREAVAYRADRLRELRMGGTGSVSGGRRSYADWYAEWGPTKTLELSTKATELCHLRNHILPRWGDRRLADITNPEVTAWAQDLLASGLAPATVHKVYGIFRQALRAAVEEGYLLDAPRARTGTIQVPKLKARFLETLEALNLEHAMDPWWALIVPLLCDVGLRIGELSSLPVHALDLPAGTVTVVNTASVDLTGRRVLSDSTKTQAGRRVIPTLTEEVAERLDRMIFERNLGPNDLLFTGPRGGPLLPRNFRERVFNPAVEKAGLAAPAPTPHALPHTAVAHWIASGASTELMEIATWLGHEKLSTVYELYGHLIKKPAPETRRRLSEFRAAAQAEASGAEVA
jgi:integrase